MSSTALHLAAAIDSARAALRAAAPGSAADLAAATNHAEACAADLERAERLLDSERASASAALRALDRVLTVRQIEAAEAAPAFDHKAEAERLRKTIALADEAIREATTLRSTPQPGEEIEDTRQRWDDAGRIEAAAKICSKAARSALRRLDIPRIGSPEQIAESIEAARTAALALKAAIDGHRERAQRLRVSKKGGAQ